MDRRNFLSFLGVGSLAAVAEKAGVLSDDQALHLALNRDAAFEPREGILILTNGPTKVHETVGGMVVVSSTERRIFGRRNGVWLPIDEASVEIYRKTESGLKQEKPSEPVIHRFKE